VKKLLNVLIISQLQDDLTLIGSGDKKNLQNLKKLIASKGLVNKMLNNDVQSIFEFSTF